MCHLANTSWNIKENKTTVLHNHSPSALINHSYSNATGSTSHIKIAVSDWNTDNYGAQRQNCWEENLGKERNLAKFAQPRLRDWKWRCRFISAHSNKGCLAVSLACCCSPWAELSYLRGSGAHSRSCGFDLQEWRWKRVFFFSPFLKEGKKKNNFHFGIPSHFSFSISFLGLSAVWMLSVKGGYMNSTVLLPI